MPIETGTRLGQYEVQDFIGQGAMGVVYRAYHVQLARTGAVKVMQAIAPDDDSIARFRREAQAIAQMRHPNILNVFDFGDYQGTPYMIVEYVPGGSMAGRMKHGPMDSAAAVEYLDGIASGLDYAHSLGIVHRDVKPANVLLAKDGTPIIADFGLAKLLQSSSVKSMTGVTTGTPAYMAPEQVTGSQVGPAADRYSLATMAYEMLTGAIPFDDEGVLELLYAQVHREPPVPSSRRPELGPQVDAVIVRGLAKDPNARWESCHAFVTALRQALAGASAPAIERTVVMAAPVAANTPVQRPAAAPASATVFAPLPAAGVFAAQPVAPPAGAAITRPRSRRRRNALLATGAVVLLLVVAVLAYAVTHPKPTLSLSSTTVAAGDRVVVSTQHLPAKQSGEVQLFSLQRTFPFRADSNGDASVEVLVPRDIGPGDHIVKVCWNAACPLQTTLHVTSPVAAIPSPSPIASAIPSPSTSATSTPNRSPSPAASPSHPSSSPSPSPVISVSPYNVKRGSTETVYGARFTPGTTVTITFFYQGASTPKTVGTQTVSASGYFAQAFTVPATASPGAAAVKVCGGGSASCLYATVNVTS